MFYIPFLNVMKGLVNIKNKEVYRDALFKNMWYLLQYIYSNNIKTWSTEKGVGSMYALRGEI